MSRDRNIRRRPPEPAPVTNSAPVSLPHIGTPVAFLLIAVAVAVFFRDILIQRAYFWEDFVFQAYPFRHFAAGALASGDIPLWNPYAHGGTPFQADIQSAIFYLPNLILTLFVNAGKLSFYSMEVFLIAHYWIAGAGMFLLARQLKLEGFFALFSAIVFIFSGFMVAQAVHPGFIQHASWIPFVLLLFDRALKQKSIPIAAGAGLVAGHAVLSGAPQISLFMLLALAIWLTWSTASAASEHGSKAILTQLALAAVTVLVTMGTAAVQLIPALELIPLSDRADLTFEQAQDGRLEWRQLITAIIPKFFGVSNPEQSTFWGGSSMLGAFWETCFYFGIAALLAALCALPLVRGIRARSNMHGFREATVAALCFSILIFAVLFALGDQFPLHRIFFEVVPGFDAFRGPARMMLLGTLALALLSGFGLREFVNHVRERPRTAEWMIAAALGVFGTVYLAVQMGFIGPPADHEFHDVIRTLVKKETNIAALFVVALGITAFLFTRRVLPPAAFVVLILLQQYADASVFGGKQNNSWYDADRYYEDTQALVQHIREEGRSDLFRLTSRSGQAAIMDRNQGMVERIFLTEGYTALALKDRTPPASSLTRSYDMLNARYRVEVDSSNGVMGIREWESYLPRAWVVHEAVTLSDDSARASFMRSDGFDPLRTAVLEVALPQQALPGSVVADTLRGAARVSGYKLNEIAIDVATPASGILVLSEIFYPGWNAYVNGARVDVLRANWSLRGVTVPAGSHSVVLRFEPVPFRVGAIISVVTVVIALFFMALWGRVRRLHSSVSEGA